MVVTRFVTRSWIIITNFTVYICVVDINLGAPDVVEIDELPSETTDNKITLKWKEPKSNGKVITIYTVYLRVMTDGKVGQKYGKSEMSL